ncbi:MAG: amino acid transporter [Deltaproteobacteria bacterium]|nr:amino acid transporter [Deltaproteobacteria bacterium]
MKFFKILNGSFLVAGTCIGGGMLALPVLSAKVGFLPALLVMGGVWAFMTIAALFYLECTLWMEKDAHLISIASFLLGRWGKFLCWTVFVFICYSSLAAYLSSGGRMIESFLRSTISFSSGEVGGHALFLLLFGSILLLGTNTVSLINSLFFFVMVALFLVMIGGGWQIDGELLFRQEWDVSGMLSLVPVMLTSFSFPGIVPVLVSYHGQNASDVKKSIFGGTIITAATYMIWLVIVMGNVPLHGPHGLLESLSNDQHASESLMHFVSSPWIGTMAQGFAFFALATSFLGLAVALSFFLSEAFKISKTSLSGKGMLALLILIPATLVVYKFERVFFSAMEISGSIGDGFLSGLIPAAMLWQGRYRKQMKGTYHFLGGKSTLAAMAILAVFMIGYEAIRILY